MLYFVWPGLADIRSVCTFYSSSLSMDRGVYITTQTAAHEMAHKLVNTPLHSMVTSLNSDKTSSNAGFKMTIILFNMDL